MRHDSVEGTLPTQKEAIHLTSTLDSTPSTLPAIVTPAPAVTTIAAYVEKATGPLADVVTALRAKLDIGLPETSTELWHGHPVWMDDGVPVAGFKAYPTFVTVLFWRGQAIADDSGKLNASGSAEMAEFKLRGMDDLDEALFDGWIQQVRELDAA